MCGIIGITGEGQVVPRLLDSLKRLEYRGYDSAGVAAVVDGRIERRRAKGKIRELEAVLAAEPLAGAVGVGHTRWATHGAPTTTNAHPHKAGRVCLVHNGIIENFAELKAELARRKIKPDNKPAPIQVRPGGSGTANVALVSFVEPTQEEKVIRIPQRDLLAGGQPALPGTQTTQEPAETPAQ